MMMRGLLCWLASSRAGMMAWMLEIFFSEKRTRESWYSTLAPLVLLIKYGEIYPLSNFMPSIMSISSYRVFPSLTVMTPSLPTLAIASAIKLPTAVSPLAEIVATCAISSGVVTGLARLLRLSHTASTATIKPRLISTGLEPWVTLSKPFEAIALAKTVAVVVPSPASSLVLLATSWTSLAPMFSNLSFNSTALATVTPSLVIFWAAPGRFNYNIPTLGAHCHRNGVSQDIHSSQHLCSHIATEPDILGKAPVGEGSKMCGGVDGLAEGDGNASSTS